MMLDHVCQGPVILIASSLGAWVSFLDLLHDACNSFEIAHVRNVSALAECIPKSYNLYFTQLFRSQLL